MPIDFLSPTSLGEALAARSAHPEAVPITGGTDVMVELNFDRRRPTGLLDLTRVPELATWDRVDGEIRVGAVVTYARIVDELARELPGLALASRTIGSPQIRNRATVGGNLGTASPTGDAHPALLAAFADVEPSTRTGVRRIPAPEFYTGPKRHAGRPDELVTAVWVRPASGPQQFSKIGTRNAMVIAVAAFGLALHPGTRRIGTGIGSAAPTPLRATEAEGWLAGELDWESRRAVPESAQAEFGRLVAAAASPIDDVRGTAAYRRHALSVMARRCLAWTWLAYQRVEVLEYADPHAPYGLRGVGEAPTISSGPSIVAAIRAATGLDVRRVPVRPEDLTVNPPVTPSVTPPVTQGR